MDYLDELLSLISTIVHTSGAPAGAAAVNAAAVFSILILANCHVKYFSHLYAHQVHLLELRLSVLQAKQAPEGSKQNGAPFGVQQGTMQVRPSHNVCACVKYFWRACVCVCVHM